MIDEFLKNKPIFTPCQLEKNIDLIVEGLSKLVIGGAFVNFGG
jgi:hypothetical protein